MLIPPVRAEPMRLLLETVGLSGSSTYKATRNTPIIIGRNTSKSGIEALIKSILF